MGAPAAIRSGSAALDFPEYISTRQQAAVAKQVHDVSREVETLLHGRTQPELSARPRPGSWCVAECLDHLTQTTRVFLPTLAAAIAAAPQLNKNRRLRTGLVPRLLIWNLRPPYRIRLKVLPHLAPKNPDPTTACAQFAASQAALLETLQAASGLAIDSVTIKSPVYARVNYNTYGAFRMLVAHQKRHVWQISQILKALDRAQA